MVKKEHLNWTDVSLRQFNEIRDFCLDIENADEDRILYQVQVLFNVNPLKISLKELHSYVQQMQFLSKPIPTMKVNDTYVINNTKYHLIKKITDVKLENWIDYQNMLKIGGNDTDNFANLISCFFIPEGKEYGEGYDIDKVRNDINEYLSIADCLSISTFFLHYQKTLLILHLLFTKRKIMKNLNKQERKKVKKEYRKAIWKIISGD